MTWTAGPSAPPLPSDEVHVWFADLSTGAADALPASWLSDEEAARARAAASATYAAFFVRTRLILRDLLGRYLQLPPLEVRLTKSAHGKPLLGPAHQLTGLEFNVSHAAGAALLAFCCGRRVGIDLDDLQRRQDWRPILRAGFSAAERTELESLPRAQRPESVMRGWIRKEAYAKARGEGFGYGFERFSVSTQAVVAGAILLNDQRDPDAQAGWLIQDLELSPPMLGSLAVEGSPLPIRCWRYARAGTSAA